MPKFALLTVGNPKIAKSVKFGYLTAVLHLAPGSLSGFNVCPKATAGCLAACLNTAGRGGIAQGAGRLTVDEIASGSRTNAIQAARVRRTKAYFADRGAFMATLAGDIRKLVHMANKLGLMVAVRLNGTSDIPWERVPVTQTQGTGRDGTVTVYPNIMAVFKRVQFYDYTKRPNRRDLPSNYRLTFSLAEGNDKDALQALNNGMNVAAVFHRVPKFMEWRREYCGGMFMPRDTRPGYRVIDGDEHDLRFLDPVGVIVGLKAKGNAKRDTSGFVR